jgi:hypothetical protein
LGKHITDRDCNHSKQRAAKGKLESGKRTGFDEETAGAPEDRRAENEKQRRDTRVQAGIFVHWFSRSNAATLALQGMRADEPRRGEMK